MRLLAAWILYRCLSTSCGFGCGYPGAPAFGRPHPLKETYNSGESVSYTCFQGYSQEGPIQRRCLHNGTWSPAIMPLCDMSLSRDDLQVSSRQTLSLYPANKSIDGDPVTCTYTDKLRPRWIRVDLKRRERVKAVALTLPHASSRDLVQISVYAISVTDSNRASYQKCASFNGKFAATTLKLMCSGGEVEGRYVHVEDDRNRVDYFSLCEVQVYVKRGSYECGEAERPAHGYFVTSKTGAIHYRCIYGYRLEGPDTRVCLGNRGQWSLYPPKCIEIVCPPLEDVEHGQIYYLGRKTDSLTFGIIANVTCDYGYHVAGNAKVCGEDGRWSRGDLSCEPIDCGLPQFEEESSLLNGTQYGSVALLHCGNTIVCREDGTWSHTLCNSSLSELGLLNDGQNDVSTGIVAGMATMVFVLLVAVIFILLIKRKKVLSENTDSSKEQTVYDNDVFYATIPVHQSSGNPIEDKKNIMSTILFTRKKPNSREERSLSQVYEEMQAPAELSEAPVYAQVDLKEKRRSRLKKLEAGERFYSVNSNCSFGEGHSEPIKELPPIPDGNSTYASLSVPLDPPDKVIGCRENIYQNSLSTSKNDFKTSLTQR